VLALINIFIFFDSYILIYPYCHFIILKLYLIYAYIGRIWSRKWGYKTTTNIYEKFRQWIDSSFT